MEKVLDIVVLGRAVRNASNVKNRQPLQKVFVCAENQAELEQALADIAKDELNVKELEYLNKATDFISYTVKPQLKTLGPKYGAKLGAIRNYLSTCDGTALVMEVKEKGSFTVNLDGADITFTADDLLISSESKEGFASLSDKGITVVLDTLITPELKLEGDIREIVSKVQTMRKDAGFNVTDKIKLYFTADADALDAFIKGKEQIATVVLAVSVEEGTADGFTKEIDVNGAKATVTIIKE